MHLHRASVRELSVYSAREEYPSLHLQCKVHLHIAVHMRSVIVASFSVCTTSARCSARRTRSLHSAPATPVIAFSIQLHLHTALKVCATHSQLTIDST